MKKKKVIDVMKSSASAGGVYEGWTEYFMKWSTQCPLRRS